MPPRMAMSCMTPLKVDLTDHDHLRYWAQTAAQLGAGPDKVAG